MTKWYSWSSICFSNFVLYSNHLIIVNFNQVSWLFDVLSVRIKPVICVVIFKGSYILLWTKTVQYLSSINNTRCFVLFLWLKSKKILTYFQFLFKPGFCKPYTEANSIWISVFIKTKLYTGKIAFSIVVVHTNTQMVIDSYVY